jgi:uncharacterized protein YggE
VPTTFAFRAVATVAIFAFLAGCLAAVASAQEPVPQPQRTLIAAGQGAVKVTPKDRDSNASIVAAVNAANAKALPLAIKDARTQAAQLATAAGVTLGALVTVSNSAPVTGPFYGPYYPVTGTFGPNQFCGKVTTRPSHIDKSGKRVFGKPRTRRTCRIPATIQRSVQLTFALA